MRIFLYYLATVAVSFAQSVPPSATGEIPVDGLSAAQAFAAGLGMQLGFEAVGLVLRMVRNVRASGNVDLSG